MSKKLTVFNDDLILKRTIITITYLFTLPGIEPALRIASVSLFLKHAFVEVKI